MKRAMSFTFRPYSPQVESRSSVEERRVDMGIYVNPGNEVFRRVTSAVIYVDKTVLLDTTNRMLNTAR